MNYEAVLMADPKTRLYRVELLDEERDCVWRGPWCKTRKAAKRGAVEELARMYAAVKESQ